MRLSFENYNCFQAVWEKTWLSKRFRGIQGNSFGGFARKCQVSRSLSRNNICAVKCHRFARQFWFNERNSRGGGCEARSTQPGQAAVLRKIVRHKINNNNRYPTTLVQIPIRLRPILVSFPLMSLKPNRSIN